MVVESNTKHNYNCSLGDLIQSTQPLLCDDHFKEVNRLIPVNRLDAFCGKSSVLSGSDATTRTSKCGVVDLTDLIIYRVSDATTEEGKKMDPLDTGSLITTDLGQFK